MRFNYIILGSLLLFLLGCDNPINGKEEYIIGTSLDSVSSMSNIDNLETVNVFDQTTRLVHSFNLDDMSKTQSVDVLNPRDEHFIVAANENSFFVDLSQSQISIYKNNGERNLDLLSFNGKPISSAYNQDLGFLVVYDDLASVALMRINETGDVLKSWVGGPIIEDDKSILSGDITDDGKLILGLSDNSLAIVDVATSLDDEAWSFSIMSVPHTDLRWLASIGSSQVLYQSAEALVLFNYQTGLVVSSHPIAGTLVHLYSKSANPHIIYRQSGGNFEMAYTDGTEFKTRAIINKSDIGNILQSNLDVSNDKWSYITQSRLYRYSGYLGINHINSGLRGREVFSYRFSDMLNISNINLPDGANLKQSRDTVFALYNSELGYAEKIDLVSREIDSIKLFNIPYIK